MTKKGFPFMLFRMMVGSVLNRKEQGINWNSVTSSGHRSFQQRQRGRLRVREKRTSGSKMGCRDCFLDRFLGVIIRFYGFVESH